MIRAACEENEKAEDIKERISFVQGNAEDTRGILRDNSVDLLVSGWYSRKFMNLLANKSVDNVKHRRVTGLTGQKFGLKLEEYCGQAVLRHSGYVGSKHSQSPMIDSNLPDIRRVTTQGLSEYLTHDHSIRTRHRPYHEFRSSL
jgi:hypothetical protein